eukprot:m.1236375 g.1236375  ORF g.1236375 m.1236375 type:complete len:1049 (-) comp24666_c0_seq8:2367-5513(-)
MICSLPVTIFVLVAGVLAAGGTKSVQNRTPNGTDLAVLTQNLHALLVPSSKQLAPQLDDEVADLLKTLNASTSQWSDIDYKDASRSWWFAAEHLRRCLLMASSHAAPWSSHHNDTTLQSSVHRAFEWWIDNDPQNQWWWMQIGIPRIICKYFLLMPSSHDLFAKALPLIMRTPTGITWTGCNGVWAATVHVMRGVLQQNASLVADAYSWAQETIKISPQSSDGIMVDGSFHQHGTQLYSGWGYGTIFSTNVLVLEAYAKGTAFSMSAAQWDIFAHLVLDGQAPATVGPNYDFLTCGRLFTYFVHKDQFGIDQGHYHYFAAFTPFELAFPSFDAPMLTPIAVFYAPLLATVDPTRARADEFKTFAQQLTSTVPVEPLHKHFYDSDYTVHHRANVSVMVHALSSRTTAPECVNSENKLGRDLADGVTTVYSGNTAVVNRGTEYADAFAVFDWSRLPGTTEAQALHQLSPDAACGSIYHEDIKRPWVGGASDGRYGCSVQDFARAGYGGNPASEAPQYDPTASGLTAIDEPYTDVSISYHPLFSGPDAHQQAVEYSVSTRLTTMCKNTSKPAASMHCDLATSITLNNLPLNNYSACMAKCCATDKCTCWAWSEKEKVDTGACQQGKPCCWLKEDWSTTLQPTVAGVYGGIVTQPNPPPPRPPTPPPSAPSACIEVGKAWFYFDDVVIAMGAGLTTSNESTCPSIAAAAVTTSLQQCNLVGPVYHGTAVLGGGGGSVSSGPTWLPDNTTQSLPLASSGMVTRTGRASYPTVWAWHNGIAYVAVAAEESVLGSQTQPHALVVAARNQTGSLYDITQGDNTTITKPIMSAFLLSNNNNSRAGGVSVGGTSTAAGTAPKEQTPAASSGIVNGSYMYAIVPAARQSDVIPNVQALSLQVLSNSKVLQAVCQPRAPTLLQAIVWPGGDGHVSGASAGCWDIDVGEATLARGGVVILVKAIPSPVEGGMPPYTTAHHAVPRGATAGVAAVAFTVATPANDAATMPVVNLTVQGVRLAGAACTAGATASSVYITMPANASAGASTTVTCTVATLSHRRD